MILVTGGCFQGKTDYACEMFGIRGEEALDGAKCPLEALYSARLVYHFHEYIRRLIQPESELLPEKNPAENFSPEELLTKRLPRENPDVVLVTNELGCGVVPVDKFDREYREKTGRILCALAKEAEEVHRVFCGIGTVIKGREVTGMEV